MPNSPLYTKRIVERRLWSTTPVCRDVRSVIEEVVTPGALALAGIVEEAWQSREHVVNKFLFYSARNRWQLLVHMAIMLHSVTHMLKLWRITTVMMSEYFVKTMAVGEKSA